MVHPACKMTPNGRGWGRWDGMVIMLMMMIVVSCMFYKSRKARLVWRAGKLLHIGHS